MLAQLYFKIMKIEEVDDKYKEQKSKLICNMLFSMIEHCPAKYYYYPIRALTEFFVHGESEKALGKRLNSKSLLHYK